MTTTAYDAFDTIHGYDKLTSFGVVSSNSKRILDEDVAEPLYVSDQLPVRGSIKLTSAIKDNGS
jgi:hypothetical protein